MAVLFPKVLLDFTAFAEFNMSSGDVGPGTAWQIRYSKADYLAMISKYMTGFLQALPVPWDGPISTDITLFFDGLSENQLTSGPGTIGAPLDLTFSTGNRVDESSTEPDFPECPFADGVGPPREDATVTTSATSTGTVTFSLRGARCFQSGWDTATEFWCEFDMSFSANSGQHYVCEPSETSGDIGGAGIPTNYLGIDYAVGTTFPTATSSIPLGDGTTAAFFLDPGGDRLVINDIQSNN